MNGWAALQRFLDTDPRDAGCDQAMEMLHVYAELLATVRVRPHLQSGVRADVQGLRRVVTVVI
jgi:hypothetical protein